MKRTIQWRLHTASPPERIYALLAGDEGRARFWAETSRSDGERFRLTFVMGIETECRVLEAVPHSRFAFIYFGTKVVFELAPDGNGGTDLLLTNSEVPQDQYHEMLPGWLNVLLPLKAAADFGVDLRNHDPDRTWRERYGDQ